MFSVGDSWQPSLWGQGQPAFDSSFRGVKRIHLSAGAWLDHGPGWLSGHSSLFQTLRSETAWREQRRQMYDREVLVPRLMATLPADGPGHPVIDDVASALARRYGVPFDHIALALYRNGQDSVALHGDTGMRDSPHDSLVATLSVGERRRFVMKPKDGGESLSLTLGWGDLVVMGGSCQRTWLHGVPKVAHAGPRLAIMFRSSVFFPR